MENCIKETSQQYEAAANVLANFLAAGSRGGGGATPANTDNQFNTIFYEHYSVKRDINTHLSDLRSALKLLEWLQDITWELDPPTFTQVPEWGSLGRNDIELDIRKAIESGTKGDGDTEDGNIAMIEVVSAARQGKSLMLNRLGHHYIQEGWTVIPVNFNGAKTYFVPNFSTTDNDDDALSLQCIREFWSLVLVWSMMGATV